MAKKSAVEKTDKTDKNSSEDGRSQALNLAISQITKQFGDGSIMKLGEAKKINVQLIPSGSLSLDLALGGGYPKGRIIEIYGPESSSMQSQKSKNRAELPRLLMRSMLSTLLMQNASASTLPICLSLSPTMANRL